MDNCIFCRIVEGIVPIIYSEDEHAIMFADQNPMAPHHMLVISKAHYAYLNELHAIAEENVPSILSSMFKLVNNYVITNKLDIGGYRIVFNTGKNAGQTVKHLHMHLLSGVPLKNDFGA